MKTVLFFLFLGLILYGCADSSKKKVEALKETFPEGTYVSKDNPFYKSLTVRGKSTVIIKDAIIGFDFTYGYEKDENFIRIWTDKSDLLLECKAKDTLVGEGFAKGCFVKQ